MEKCQYKQTVFSSACSGDAKWAVHYWSDYPAAEWQVVCEDHLVAAESEGNWRATEELK